MAIQIVDIPPKNGDFPWQTVNFDQRAILRPFTTSGQLPSIPAVVLTRLVAVAGRNNMPSWGIPREHHGSQLETHWIIPQNVKISNTITQTEHLISPNITFSFTVVPRCFPGFEGLGLGVSRRVSGYGWRTGSLRELSGMPEWTWANWGVCPYYSYQILNQTINLW